MKTLNDRLSSWCIFAATAALTAFPASNAGAGTLGIADVPLFLTTGVEPNVMMMIDNSGSMQNIVPDTPYDPDFVYLSDCPTTNSNRISADTAVEIRIESGSPRIRYNNTNYVYGTGRNNPGRRCFDSNTNYLAKLFADTNNGAGISGYLPAQYTGNYLNWYFNTNRDPSGCANNWSSGRKPCAQSRMMIAKTAGKSLVNSMSGSVRAGLSTYNGGDGGKLLEAVAGLNGDKRATLRTRIDALAAAGNTPLAETLADIGYYFSRDATNLTLHPDSSPSIKSRRDVFKSSYTRDSSWNTGAKPIEYSCQKSFAVLLTDGRPNGDRDVSTLLADYDGDCVNANPSCLTFDRKQNREYESDGSDYLDDVALALYEMDLRPDLVSNIRAKNNLATYLISFADDQAINDPLIKNTAKQGGGEFFVAGNETQLTAAFEKALAAIVARSGSAASASVNTGAIGSSTRIYQAKFDSASWTGQLISLPVRSDGTLGAREWDAATKVPAAADRNIITANSDGAAIRFRWNDLDDTRRRQLDPAYTRRNSALAMARLDYLRGDTANEAPAGLKFRPRLTRLGDIVGSAPMFVGDPSFSYRDTLETKPYSAFRRANSDTDGDGPDKGRKQVVYAGANDGMLHAFDAQTGTELFGFIPSPVFGNLRALSDVNYSHKFYVDGAPIMGDVFFNGDWRTVLVGGLNNGGQGIYALDITKPTQFDEDDADDLLLWEFTDKDDPLTEGVTGDPDLGYTYSQPAIVRLQNGDWAAIFGNGYNNTVADGSVSTTGNAVLYIVRIRDGKLIKKIDTGVGTAQDPKGQSRPNGLATPAVVDINGDDKVDYVFAGDLFGNMWKFDIRSSSPASWTIAHGASASPQPLFTAVDPTNSALRQPITSRPEVIRGPRGVGMMVLFGTGKYIESTDSIINADAPEIQTYYGLFDRNSGAGSDRIVDLQRMVQQTIDAERTFDISGRSFKGRITSQNAVNDAYTGWYINLKSPANGYEGERQVTNTVVRGKRAIFTTLIPDPDPCGFGGKSWLMTLDALTGARLATPPYDTNNDGVVDGRDEAISGLQPDGGIVPGPGILMSEDGTKEYNYLPGTADGDISIVVGDPGKGAIGRQSWRQIR